MLEILNSSKDVIKKNLKSLAEDYKKHTGRVVCLSCPSDIQYMISSLKTIYKMKSFQFKKAFAQYKDKKGDKVTISNSNMTDEAAINFLRTNPERIRLFSNYPENWKDLINDGAGGDAAINEAERLAEEAAKKALKDGSESAQIDLINSDGESGQIDLIDSIEDQEAVNELAVEGEKIVDGKEEDCCEEDKEAPCEECKEKKRQELSKMKLAELREAYPDIKATSIKNFVDKVINQ